MELSLEKYSSVKGNNASEKLLNRKKELLNNYKEIEKEFRELFSYTGEEGKRKELLQELDNTIGKKNNNYIKTIKNLDEKTRNVGIAWLSSIVEKVKDSTLKHLPSFK
jgi:hypothetical protein